MLLNIYILEIKFYISSFFLTLSRRTRLLHVIVMGKETCVIVNVFILDVNVKNSANIHHPGKMGRKNTKCSEGFFSWYGTTAVRDRIIFI